MNYITDYQLDIDGGFQCKVNGNLFVIYFGKSSDDKHWFITDQFRKLLIKLELNPDVVVRPYGKFGSNHLCYCDSKQQCYDLCQHIVKMYFRPKQTETDKKEWCEKSRKHLNPYYHGIAQVNFPNGTFILKQFRAREYFWSGSNPNIGSNDIYRQFELSKDQILKICDNLKLHAYFVAHILLFGDRKDAIKFTDYLIETYIIKKEKTYDTNQLRKERTAISRGAKPAGGIIHGRRSKASVRCGRIEHKACFGN